MANVGEDPLEYLDVAVDRHFKEPVFSRDLICEVPHLPKKQLPLAEENLGNPSFRVNYLHLDPRKFILHWVLHSVRIKRCLHRTINCAEESSCCFRSLALERISSPE